jgi:pyruvate-formate lyase-activating enzyme
MELGFLPQWDSLETTGDHLPLRKLSTVVNYPSRPYRSLEIELSTRCNLFCPPCPRANYGSNWIDRDMSFETFERIAGAFDRFDTIHFRGWGEPLMNPHFPEMVRRAYQSGAKLVLTTNGAAPIDPGLLPYFGAVNFRLDYGRAHTYERRNSHAKFNRVIFNISQVLHDRDLDQSPRPKVILLFAKNKYSLKELPAYLENAIRLSPDRVVFYQPKFHVRPVDARGQLPVDVDIELVTRMDQRLTDMARSAGLDMLNQRVVSQGRTITCGFDPGRSLFANWRGQVAMCRYSALPVANGQYYRYQQEKPAVLQTRVLGDLSQKEIDQIAAIKNLNRSRKECSSVCGAPNLTKNNIQRERRKTASTDPTGKVVYLSRLG